MKALRETDIVRHCLEWLRLKRVTVWRNNSGGAKLAGHGGRGQFVRFGMPGSADIIGLLKGGRFIAVEVKRPGGKLRENQQAFLDAVVEAGGFALVVHSVDELIREIEPMLE